LFFISYFIWELGGVGINLVTSYWLDFYIPRSEICLQFTVYSLQFTVYGLRFTVYNLLKPE